jgi:hypothetical protein
MQIPFFFMMLEQHSFAMETRTCQDKSQYDANGNPISFFDKTGRRWIKIFDRLNRDIAVYVVGELIKLNNFNVFG